MHFSTLSQLLALLALSTKVLSAPAPIPTSTDAGHPGGPRAAAACRVPRLHVRAEPSGLGRGNSDPHASLGVQDPQAKQSNVAQRVWDACRYQPLRIMLKSGLKSEKPRPGYTEWLENKNEQRARKAEEEGNKRAEGRWKKDAERRFEVMRISHEKSQKQEAKRLKKHSQLMGSLHEQNFI